MIRLHVLLFLLLGMMTMWTLIITITDDFTILISIVNDASRGILINLDPFTLPSIHS